jgi:hypothetical protein
MIRGLIAAAVALGAFAAAPAWALSELVVTSFTITPSSGGAGTPVDVRFGVFNGGDAAARPVVVTVVLVPTTATPTHEGITLGEWEAPREIGPGLLESTSMRVTIPAGGPAGTGYICAEVDLVNLVREVEERNNRRCAVFDARPPKPNLVIRSLTLGAVSGVSQAVRIVIQNIGRAPAGAFNVEAFDAPAHRNVLLLGPCRYTAADRARGYGACPATYVPGLAIGESRTLDVWFTLPGVPVRGSRHSVDITVDGCSRALSPGLPAYCRVDESVEADNTRRVIFTAP